MQIPALKLILWPIRLAARLPMLLYFRLVREQCGNIWVVDMAGSHERSDFRDQIDRAMRFIREHDSRRAARIEQDIDYIVNSSFIEALGLYSHASRACFLNYEWLYEHLVGWAHLLDDTQRVLTMQLASTIVHEATHARLHNAGIPYDERHRERVERVCERQEFHFMRRSASDFRDACEQPVDWSKEYNFEQSRGGYERFWAKSRWDRIRGMLRKGWDGLSDDKAGSAAATWREHHRLYWDYTANYRPWALSMLYTRGCMHAMANNHVLAADDYRMILERDSEFDEARLGLAAQLFHASRYEEALPVAKELHARGQENAPGWISATLCQLNCTAEALEWLDRDVSDDDAAGRTGFRAMLLMELGRNEEAIDCFRCALKDQPVAVGSKAFSYLSMQARVLQQVGQEREAHTNLCKLKSIIDEWRQASDASPVETAAYVLRTDASMYCAGDSTRGSRLLVCPDASDAPDLRKDLERIAGRLLARINSESHDYEDLYLRSLLSPNEDYVWREVPESLTDGRTLWVVDMALDRVLLPSGQLHDDWVECLISRSGSRYSTCLTDRFLLEGMQLRAAGLV